MRKPSSHLAVIFGLSLVLAAVWSQVSRSADVAPAELRPAAQKAVEEGNFKDAYEMYRQVALSKDADPATVGDDLRQAVQCLTRLNRQNEIDAFIEEVVETHAKNWRLLWAAADVYISAVQHQGFIISGEFQRGPHRGGGRVVNSIERDRTRALQLMQQAVPLLKDDPNTRQISDFYLQLASYLLNNRGHHESWRLQYLTDLSELPDYEDGWYYYRGTSGAPVDAEGNPVFHSAAKTWEQAETDGQRWRFALQQAVEYQPDRLNQVRNQRAQFLWQQFGVQTMAHYGQFFARQGLAGDAEDKPQTFALDTLKENETIAKLATGIKRFELPDDHNFIKLFQQVAAEQAGDGYVSNSIGMLGQIFSNRRQYPKAAEWYRTLIKRFNTGQHQLDQIVDNWGRFEPVTMQPEGEAATVEYRFRNGKLVTFTAHEIRVPELLKDVKAYLSSKPGRVDWQAHNIGNLGYRLVQQDEKKYIGREVAEWQFELNPRPDHVDDRVTVNTPLKESGAYLLKAQMEDGNTSHIILWLADTAIVKKPLDGKMYYYVGDAGDGSPVANARLEMFGFRQQYINNQIVVDTIQSVAQTNKDGEVITDANSQPNNYQWLVTATKGDDHFAYLGWTGVWYGQRHDQAYNQVRVFPITDRPVYRPEQTVKYKFWIRRAQYDAAKTSQFANQEFPLRIYDPKGERIVDKMVTSDEFGGIEGELELPKGATLGVYRFAIERPHQGNGLVGVHGQGTFRVEEYKKPEFEVTIDAPTEPVMLGETIEATIKAKYYFGSPVVNAKVKYKIFREEHTDQWYPVDRWDWLYGRGYWWFGENYTWYPGFERWGCFAPWPWWWQGQRNDPPELVAEVEVPIGPDGTVKVQIDTAAAKEIHGDQNHKYRIEAEVVDQSRRTITGSGSVLVAKEPFKITSWTDRGFYRVGDTVEAHFKAHTLDNKGVEGHGFLKLFRIEYQDGKPVETELHEWPVNTDAEGEATKKMAAARGGQYRLSYTLTDKKKHTIEGGYIFTIIGDEFDGSNYEFNALELVPDRREYDAGETVNLQVNTAREDSTVLLFIRPANGIYLNPRVVRVKGKSFVDEIPVIRKDMPNFFIEAITISNGQLHEQAQQIVVPPVKRIVDIEVVPSAKEYKPGEKATVQLKLTDYDGTPLANSQTVVAVYDKALEYISGGSNVADIKEFFWNWKRNHHPNTEHSLARHEGNLTLPNKPGMNDLGVFGGTIVEEFADGFAQNAVGEGGGGFGGGRLGGDIRRMRGAVPHEEAAFAMDAAAAPAPMAAKAMAEGAEAGPPADEISLEISQTQSLESEPFAEATTRSNFADTAFWAGSLETDENGLATIEFDMPENLTAWNIRVWGMGHGTSVGEGSAEVVTRKNLIVRMQAPRFFVETDEVVLSANVHNYLESDKQVQVRLEFAGDLIEPMQEAVRDITIPAGGEQRVDWRVRVVKEGEAKITMKALSDEESDAMQMSFPVYVHGMDKMESYSNALRPEDTAGEVTFTVPEKRREAESRIEVRYSPTLAGAMVDALPYMVDYPYGCTEQTLNRFLPTVIVQNILQEMNLDLEAIRTKRTNLNAQELGDAQERAKQWQRFDRNPVFSEAEVDTITRAGIDRLQQMQVSDGGWGWFSGFGEQSYPHTTAVVVHGLQIAKQNDVALPQGMLERGVAWLQQYQAREIQKIKNAPTKTDPWKSKADNLDAFVYMVLVDATLPNEEMMEFLYRDRVDLSVYAKAMYGLALFSQGEQQQKLDMILKNIEQFVVQDDENQTAWLNLPQGYWWYWYGSENEAHAYYLKLLSRTDSKGKLASRLVKYMLNNRKHATYWNSTRDTALCIEAMAEYMQASGETRPNMTVEVWLDGELKQSVEITPETLFQFENKFVLTGSDVTSGKHTVELRKKGQGPLYFNTYVSYFTQEDFITKAGLEIKVEREFYKLVPVEDATAKVAGSRGQVVDQRVEKYERQRIENLAELTSGDLVEIELTIDSKNDYEYLLFEDMKAAGFEPVEVRSGYNGNDLGAYMELRDNRVSFFVRQLARGKHSVSYRMRAEIPGKFSALPTRASAMYAPELRANSDEWKVNIVDER